MKHEFDVLLHAEDYEHAKSVAKKDIKLEHVEKFAIRDLAKDIKERGSLELVQPGCFDELVDVHVRGGDGIEPLNCGIESRKVAIAALLRVMREPDTECRGIVHQIIRIARDLEMPVENPFDC
ncbi:TPA: hypothetical protein GF725_10085 [Escherichia coli]|uniref:hypothetical protein n=1 Tax=Escherichia coli TaxID=562 RepID=UPI000B42842C|nr:hypothetical protein [Escherichia coli]OWF04955.1 hypothetical protein A8M74_03900 [Escherichia coli]RCO12977.1 hypothetical protein BEA14_15640 [Escherichia coli]HAH2556696.1 hypothetical protein [Escherichia coli]HAI0721134.1 hypothetical protein [Escherichia coli]